MKRPKIQTRSWVHMGGGLVETSTLSPEDKRRVANAIMLTYMNALYAGQAEFFVVEDEAPT